MISKKFRSLIFLSYVLTASIVVTIQILPGIVNVGLNEADPLYFDRQMQSTFKYRSGSTQTQSLSFNVINVGVSQSTAETQINGANSQQSDYTPEGFYVDQSGTTDYQSVLWVHITGGDRSEIRNYDDEEFKVIDPDGILGSPNEVYTYKIVEDDVYWSEEPGLHGAQFSLKFDILDESGALVGTGEMDKTCGLIFRLDLGGVSIELIETTYDISRNRVSALIALIICVIVVPTPFLLYFLYYKKKVKGDDISREELIDIVFLISLGQFVAAFDLWVDVWLYAPFGLIGNLTIRFIILGGGLGFSLYRKYELKWLIPTLLEVGFLLGMVLGVGDPYVPHLTAFMGGTMSFLVLLWLTGYKRQEHDSTIGWLINQAI